MMPYYFAGMKRRPGLELTPENESSSNGSQEQLFEPSKAKKHQLQALRNFGHEGCLASDWTSPVLSMDHQSESCMDTFFANSHSNIPAPWHCVSESLSRTSPFLEDHSSKYVSSSKTSNDIFGVNLSKELGKPQAVPQIPQNLVYPRDLCPELQSTNDSQFQRFPENDSAFLLPPRPLAVQRCPECAAGKSGHIHHIGRWRLMDTE